MINTELICVVCHMCGNSFNISVTAAEIAKYQGGMPIQDAMPNLTADERELIISQTCGACWDKLFPPED